MSQPPAATPPGLSRRLLRHVPLLAAGVLGGAAAAAAWPSPRAWGLLGVAVGTLLNVLVIGLNGGSMPYVARPHEPPEPPESIYRPIDARTRARWLADWIDLGRWYISPGDVVIALGFVAWLVALFVGAGATP